jgi:ATP-dependent helicase/nuclease subunit A
MKTPLQQTAFRFEPLVPDPRPKRRNIVIEAGAGTGKTTAIVAEVLTLMLEQEELAPERIILVTFTEKAAGEIADRIHDALTELSTRFDDERIVWPTGSPQPLFEVPPDRREAYRRACSIQLARIDSLRSQTIHSFCQSLLRMYPIEAGLDPQFKVIEGFERSLLHGELYDAWLDEETRTNPSEERLREWEILLDHYGYLFLIRNQIVSLIDHRELLLEEGYELGDIRDVEDSLIAALADVACFDEERFCRYVKTTPRPPRGSTIDAWIDYLAPIAGEIRTLNLPKGRRLEPLSDALKVLRSDDKKGSSIYDRLTGHRAAVTLHAVARRYLAFLDREKRALGVVDFDDLLIRTLALLQDETVLERVRQQFDYLFVDEFQDTDRTQARIIDRLARDRTGAYVPGKTIIVGDPKQSIYAFRRADPETYYQMMKELIGSPEEGGGAEHRILGDQYRSDPPLVDAVNAMFTSMFPPQPHDPNVFRPAYHRLRASRTKLHRDTDARITFLAAEHDETSNRFIDEAEAIAQWIASRRDGGERDLQRFAILFRRLTKIEDYLDTFERLGINYVLPPMRLFLDRRAPVDLLAVLRAIAYPFDRGAEISAARTPYFALTDVEIVDGLKPEPEPEPVPVPEPGLSSKLEERPGNERPGSGAGSGPYSRFRVCLNTYRDTAKHLTVSSLIDLLIASSGIEQIYAAAIDGERSRRYLDHLRDIAFEYDRKIGGSVRQFVDEITRRRTEPDEMEPSLIDESRNAVRILSVHAAKGLEFETVILPDLSFPVRPAEIFAVEEPRRLVFREGAETLSARYHFAGGRPLREIASEREDAEMRRLFYVAVTRAKTEVVFVCDPGKPRSEGFIKCVNEVFGDRSWTEEPRRELRDMNVGGESVTVAFERMEQRLASVQRRRLMDADLESRLVNGDLPDSDVAPPTIDLATLTPAEAAKQRARGRNRVAGILLHRILERWDGTSPVEPLLRSLGAEAGIDDEAFTRVRQRLAVVAKSPTLARISRAETIARELPVHVTDERGAVAERRIDRLLREAGRELVIDYKSGTPDAARLAADRAQVEQYCRAIEQITGRPCGGMLWYIDLEADQVVEW